MKVPIAGVVSFVQVTVICIHRTSVGNGNARNVWTYIAEKVVIDFVQVVVLVAVEVQFKGHSVGQEAGIDPEVAQAGCVAPDCAQAKGQQAKNKCSCSHKHCLFRLRV